MIERDLWRRLGEELALSEGRELRLGQEASALFVESGSLVLFTSELVHGRPAGPRRVLARLASGRVACAAERPAWRGRALWLAPVERASLRRVPLAELWKLRARGDVAVLLDEWIQFLASLIPPRAEPRNLARVDAADELTLEPGQTLAPRRRSVSWLRILSGSVRCLGSDGSELASEDGPLVLGHNLWIEAPEGARIALWRSADTRDLAELEAGLGWLQELVLEHLWLELERESEQELHRLRERERLEAARLERATAELAALFEPGVEPIPREDPLLAALTVVARRSGLELRAPGEQELHGRVDPLEAVAKASRLRLRRIVLEHRWWRGDCGDLLAFTREEPRRPLALLRTRGGRYELLDPASGQRRSVDRRVAAGLAPEAVLLYRSLPERPLALLDLLRFSLERRRRDLLRAVAPGLAATLLGMLVPQATALLMDHAIPDADRRLCLELGAWLFAAALGQILFHLAQGFALLRVGAASEIDSEAALWDRLLRLRPAFFRRFSSGDLQARVAEVGSVGRELGNSTLSALFALSLTLLNLALLYYYSPALASAAVGIGLAVLAFTLALGNSIRVYVRQLLELDGRFYGLVVQLVRAVSKLRVAGAGERAFGQWLARMTTVLGLTRCAALRSQWLAIFNQSITALSSILLFLLAHERIVESRASGLGGMSLGSFLAFSAAFGVYLAGILALGDTVLDLLDLSVHSQRIDPILKEPPESDSGKRDPGPLAGAIALENVDFRYTEGGPLVLAGISASIEPGEFAAVVGPSGSGKSSLLRLLLGFEVPSSGIVRYDGRDLSELDVTAVRRQLGVVLQGGRLDAGSIFENIACGSPISLDDAWAAAEDAGVADEIREMPMGMHTVISAGGGNLSGGQRQRLLVARALVQRPRVLFLDEATSALDNRTQAVISRSLERLRATRLVVAHRLSTIRNADRILVIEAGRIVQQGSFEELAAQAGGLFERLMKRQSA